MGTFRKNKMLILTSLFWSTWAFNKSVRDFTSQKVCRNAMLVVLNDCVRDCNFRGDACNLACMDKFNDVVRIQCFSAADLAIPNKPANPNKRPSKPITTRRPWTTRRPSTTRRTYQTQRPFTTRRPVYQYTTRYNRFSTRRSLNLPVNRETTIAPTTTTEQTTTTTTTTTSTTTTTTTMAPTYGIQRDIARAYLIQQGFEKYVDVSFGKGRISSLLLSVPVANAQIFIGCYNKKNSNSNIQLGVFGDANDLFKKQKFNEMEEIEAQSYNGYYSYFSSNIPGQPLGFSGSKEIYLNPYDYQDCFTKTGRWDCPANELDDHRMSIYTSKYKLQYLNFLKSVKSMK